ncbi:hypothetical protein BJ742DRAFT_868723 [Cladochytrium replicatum]|nr:hypothetical protein BJ742DRAFT_868723 [Cladochytrium replicatum]
MFGKTGNKATQTGYNLVLLATAQEFTNNRCSSFPKWHFRTKTCQFKQKSLLFRNRESQASKLLKDLQPELANEKKASRGGSQRPEPSDPAAQRHKKSPSSRPQSKKVTKVHETWWASSMPGERDPVHRGASARVEADRAGKHCPRAYRRVPCKAEGGVMKQVQDWMTRYEGDTESKTAELEALKQNRTSDPDRFEELVAY